MSAEPRKAAPGGAAAGDHRVVIIGGGITGLAAAYFLEQRARAAGRALACDLVEADGRLGGKVRTEHHAGLVIEQGPDSYLARKTAATDLIRAVGLATELEGVTPGRLKTYVLHRGRLHPLPEGMVLVAPTRVGPFLRSSLLSPLAKARLALDLVLPPRRAAGDESLGHFIRRRLGDEALQVLAGPLLAGIHAGDPDHLSLLATYPQFRDLERTHGSLVRGLLRQARAAAAARPPGPGAAVAAPAADRPPDRPGGRSFFLTLRRGLGTLPATVAAALAVTRAHTGRRAERLQRRPGGGYTVTLDDGTSLAAGAVVLAVPAFAAAPLMAPLAPAAADELAAIPYASTAVVALAFPRDRVGHRMPGSGFVVAGTERRAITACTWVSSKWPHAAPGDLALVRCFVGKAGDEALALAPTDEVVAAVRRELADIMGLAAEPALTRIYRWPRAMPQYQVGHLERLGVIDQALAGDPGLVLAGAGYRGIGIPDCISQGAAAADRVAAALGWRP